MKLCEVKFPVIAFDDGFQPGLCSKCPMKRVIGRENAMRVWEESITCKMDFSPVACPIRVVKSSKHADSTETIKSSQQK